MGVDWSQQVKPAIAAVPIPGSDTTTDPQMPVAFPVAYWARSAEPVYSGGQPFVIYASAYPPTAAALSPGMQAALELQNAYRARWVPA